MNLTQVRLEVFRLMLKHGLQENKTMYASDYLYCAKQARHLADLLYKEE